MTQPCPSPRLSCFAGNHPHGQAQPHPNGAAREHCMYALACLRTMRAVALAEEAASRRRARSPGGGYARQGFTFMTPQGQGDRGDTRPFALDLRDDLVDVLFEALTTSDGDFQTRPSSSLPRCPLTLSFSNICPDTQKADQAPADERHPMKKSSQFSSFGKVNGTEEEKKDTPLDDPQAHLSQIVEASDDSKPIFKDTACLSEYVRVSTQSESFMLGSTKEALILIQFCPPRSLR